MVLPVPITNLHKLFCRKVEQHYPTPPPKHPRGSTTVHRRLQQQPLRSMFIITNHIEDLSSNVQAAGGGGGNLYNKYRTPYCYPMLQASLGDKMKNYVHYAEVLSLPFFSIMKKDLHSKADQVLS